MRILLLCAFSILVVISSFAQDRANPRGVGMARTVNTAALGIESFGVNPANLGLPDNRSFDLGLAPFGAQVRTELFSYEVYLDYFTGVTAPDGQRVARVLSQEDEDKILSYIPDNPGTWFTFDVTPISFAVHNSVIGGLGFAMTEHVGTVVRMSRDMFKLAFYGLDSSGILYDLRGSGATAWWWREYNFSYGRYIPLKIPFVKNLYAGFAYKKVNGYGIFETLDYQTTFGNAGTGNQYRLQGTAAFKLRRSGIDLLAEESEEDFTPLPEPAGKGSGFDFGLTAELMNSIHVSASVVNLGSIHWEKNIVETSGSGNISVDNPFTKAGEDSLEEQLSGENITGEAFDTPLPSQLRFGVSMWSHQVPFLKWLPGRMLLAMDYTQGLNESLGNTTTPRISMGMEYRIIPLLPLRTGFAFGGDDKFRWSAGTGLDFHFLEMSLALENFGLFFSPSDFQMLQVSFGLRVKV